MGAPPLVARAGSGSTEAVFPSNHSFAWRSAPRPYATCPEPMRTTMIAFSPPCFLRAWTAFQAIAASHAHCARYIAWNIGSGMLPWSASSDPKKALKSRWCSALSRSTFAGRSGPLVGRQRVEALLADRLHERRAGGSPRTSGSRSRGRRGRCRGSSSSGSPSSCTSGTPSTKSSSREPCRRSSGRATGCSATGYISRPTRTCRPALVQLVDHLELDAVELGARVALAHEDQARLRELPRDLGRR